MIIWQFTDDFVINPHNSQFLVFGKQYGLHKWKVGPGQLEQSRQSIFKKKKRKKIWK